MISLDGVTKGVAGNTSRASKLSKKEEFRKSKFIKNSQTQGTSGAEPTIEVTDIAPMLFLQEINGYDIEQQTLAEFGKKAIWCLRNLQLALIGGELQEHHLRNIKEILENNKAKFIIPELAQIADDLVVRMAVEIAKIEINKDANPL